MTATLATKQRATFTCAFDTKLGAFQLAEGESVRVVSDGMGKFDLYVEWADGSIGKYTANEINKLAGYEVVQ